MNSHNSNNYIQQLPVELLKIIFDNLETDQKVECHYVCLGWRAPAQLSLFNRIIFPCEEMVLYNKEEMELVERLTRLGGATRNELGMVKTLIIGNVISRAEDEDNHVNEENDHDEEDERHEQDDQDEEDEQYEQDEEDEEYEEYEEYEQDDEYEQDEEDEEYYVLNEQDGEVPSVTNMIARQLLARLPCLQEITIHDRTICLFGFLVSNIPAMLATRCQDLRCFRVNHSLLANVDTCVAYLGTLKAMHSILSDVVLPNGDYSSYGDAFEFLSDFDNLTTLDVRGVAYFVENQDRVQLLLDQRPGLVVLSDSLE